MSASRGNFGDAAIRLTMQRPPVPEAPVVLHSRTGIAFKTYLGPRKSTWCARVGALYFVY